MHPTVPATARHELMWACIEARGWDDANWEIEKGLEEKFGVKIKHTSCNRKIATLTGRGNVHLKTASLSLKLDIEKWPSKITQTRTTFRHSSL